MPCFSTNRLLKCIRSCTLSCVVTVVMLIKNWLSGMLKNLVPFNYTLQLYLYICSPILASCKAKGFHTTNLSSPLKEQDRHGKWRHYTRMFPKGGQPRHSYNFGSWQGLPSPTCHARLPCWWVFQRHQLWWSSPQAEAYSTL